jgi:hemolysin activation/secretion protein
VRALWFFLLLSFPFLIAPAAAASTPNEPRAAQELQRQQERERVLRQQLERRPDVRLPAGDALDAGRIPDGETPCFPIRELRLDDPTGRFG